MTDVLPTALDLPPAAPLSEDTQRHFDLCPEAGAGAGRSVSRSGPVICRVTRRAAFALGLVAMAGSASADLPTLPDGARLVLDRTDPVDSYAVATGPATAGVRPDQATLTGPRRVRVWRAQAGDDTTAVLAAELSLDLTLGGYDIVFACAAADCGGFDFRTTQDVEAPPDMFVDLGRFRYVAARRGGADKGPEALASVWISPAGGDLYVQLTEIGADAQIAAAPSPGSMADTPSPGSMADTPSPGSMADTSAPAPARGDLVQRLTSMGYAVLEDVRFAEGAAILTARDEPRLTALAEYLTEDPRRRVALVGHSDWTGSLAENERLSRARAASVADVLRGLGVDDTQMTVAGLGFLAPRAGNTDAAGRAANRRVEIVSLPDAPG